MPIRTRVIAKAHSPISGNIRVVEGWGFRHLSTDSIQHSGGIVREIWTKTLKSHAAPHASWLVLGVAGGSVVHYLSRHLSPSRIVGVEIDPIMVDLGKRYFGLDTVPNFEIITADAFQYIQDCREKFDFIVVDLFGSDSPPEFVYSPTFIQTLKRCGKTVFINHLYATPAHKTECLRLENAIIHAGFSPTPLSIRKNKTFSF